jgi:ABC-type dipeptide/oligopeptide/nickel transport system permease subunit
MIREKRKIGIPVWISIAIMALILIIMIFAKHLAIHDPTLIDLSIKLQKPSHEYPFGTDDYGRCIFCRCIFAIRNSVGIAFTIELVSVVIGMMLGMSAAYYGRLPDRLFNTVSNALMSFPSVILIMLIVAFLGASTRNIILAMLLVDWIWYARLSRSLTLSLKERKYVQAAKLNGASGGIVLLRHITPHIIPQMAGQFTLALGNVILGLAGFSFLGIGIQRPTPELGIMISDGCSLIRTNFSVLLWPGVILFIIVLAFNIVGEWLSGFLRRQG